MDILQARKLSDDSLQAIVIAESQRCLPASKTEIEEALAVLAAAYPRPKGTDAELQARKRIYVEALADLPPRRLKSGIMGALHNCKFFPSIAEIREHAALADFEKITIDLSHSRLAVARREIERRAQITDQRKDTQ
ncbi:MAG: hypothetical protein R3E02_01885 [Blastomonas sp.]